MLGGGRVLSVCEHKCPTAVEPHRRAQRTSGSGLETQWATFRDLSSVCHVDRTLQCGRCYCPAWSNGRCLYSCVKSLNGRLVVCCYIREPCDIAPADSKPDGGSKVMQLNCGKRRTLFGTQKTLSVSVAVYIPVPHRRDTRIPDAGSTLCSAEHICRTQ